MTSVIFQGAAPTVGSEAFSNTPDGAVALVTIEEQASFGDLGTDWNGLTVSMSVSDMITALNAQNAAVATARTAGQGDVTSDPASYSLVTQTNYNTVIAERDARPTQTNYNAVIAERDARPTQTAYDTAVAESRTAGRSDVTSTPASYNLTTTESYNTVVAERDARPTQTAYDTVVEQRDARFTEDQINAMTVDPTVGRNAAGNMQVDISFIHSTDLENFSPFALSPDWVSVVDGKITLEFPPNDDDTFFYRLGVQ